MIATGIRKKRKLKNYYFAPLLEPEPSRVVLGGSGRYDPATVFNVGARWHFPRGSLPKSPPPNCGHHKTNT